MAKLVLKGNIHNLSAVGDFGRLIGKVTKDFGIKGLAIEIYEDIESLLDSNWEKHRRGLAEVFGVAGKANVNLFAVGVHGPSSVFPIDLHEAGPGCEEIMEIRKAFDRTLRLLSMIREEFRAGTFVVVHPANAMRGDPREKSKAELRLLRKYYLEQNRHFIKKFSEQATGTKVYIEAMPPLSFNFSNLELSSGGICALSFDDLRAITRGTGAEPMGDMAHVFLTNRFFHDRHRRLLRGLFPDTAIALEGTLSPEVVSPPETSMAEMARQCEYIHVADAFFRWHRPRYRGAGVRTWEHGFWTGEGLPIGQGDVDWVITVPHLKQKILCPEITDQHQNKFRTLYREVKKLFDLGMFED